MPISCEILIPKVYLCKRKVVSHKSSYNYTHIDHILVYRSCISMYIGYKVREPNGSDVILTAEFLVLFSFPFWTTVLLTSKLLCLFMLQSNTFTAAGVLFLYTGKNILPNGLVTGTRRAVLLNPPT